MKTDLFYKGKIKLYINIGQKTIEIKAHNTGTDILKQSICRFLAGQYRGTCDIPSYLDVRNNSNVSVLVNVIPLSGRSFINENGEIYAKCDCSILYSSLISGIVSQPGVNYKLVLCADVDPNIPNSSYRDLAEVAISSTALSRITVGTSAAIEWRMYVENQADS